ncbi:MULTISPECIES: MerR family transcriptional regulator [Pseudoalteromonas]|jgi:MerR family mercuric resistance operon transcriptional regulator|uniref:MerR family transcriptional regulator n=1 Tax=Pseudoalteromonas TaxID=53246 RepID=UPI001190FFBB|nr:MULTISPECIES: MerR family transcriptional regulator [Pseudoalteromonas]MBB1350344.1 MerR family transcriptional regulator [Pseudoalteromonas sp. SG45-3]MBB1357451.1 MerR family transcriptional regulator [Pseudoalteromonas sp. SG45-6]TVU68202.1 MerR family transcriptional regulator [Pseudoalteromonas elyakovii]
MNSQKIENIPIEHASFLNKIPDFNGFIRADDELLDFPLSISQLANAAQTTVHTVRNYVLENLLHCNEQTKSGYGRYNLCALKRLRFIRTARAAGLLLLDIKPLLMAINADNNNIPDETLNLLNIKIQHKKAYLELVTKQIEQLVQI